MIRLLEFMTYKIKQLSKKTKMQQLLFHKHVSNGICPMKKTLFKVRIKVKTVQVPLKT